MRNCTCTGMTAKVAAGLFGMVAAAGMTGNAKANDWAVSIGGANGHFAGRVVVGDGAAALPRVGISSGCATVPHSVWREPVYELRDVVVNLPAEVVRERVPVYSHRGRVIGYEWRERVIRPARTEIRSERVLVRAGYYETVYDTVCKPVIHKPIYGPVITPYGGRGCGTTVVRTAPGVLRDRHYRGDLRVARPGFGLKVAIDKGR
ncbi:MAG: hypothetical protein J5J06_07835 [Phycisphaerae bacterium]|nr:hypothetical protein [Phycisphaerae bacterium]